MKKLLLLLLCALPFQLFAQSVVVNKFYNQGTTGSGAAGDAVELLVIQNNLDMRGMIVKDFTSNMDNDGGGKFIFSNNPLWSAVRAGTLIVLRNDNSAADIDPNDFKLDVGLNNATYFANGGGTFDIATTDMVMVKSAGSGVAGVNGSIHALASGAAGAQFNATQPPKLIASQTTSAQRFAAANNSTQSLADFNGTDATGNLQNLTLGQPNNPNNAAYIQTLRNANPNAALEVRIDGVVIPKDSAYAFPTIPVNSTLRRSLVVRNVGQANLVVEAIALSSGRFVLENLPSLPATLAQSQQLAMQIAFTPNDTGLFQSGLLIDTNDPNNDPYTATIRGRGQGAGNLISIAAARALPLGSVVTVGGRITVANQFGGPAYFQDGTGGMAAFIPALHAQAQLGDSVIITGATTEFQPSPNQPGTGLFQISEVNNITPTFQIIPGGQVLVQPRVVTISQINESLEGQLVVVEDATIRQLNSPNVPFAFQGNTNYRFFDATGEIQLRIDNDVSSLVGATAPVNPTTVIGVVSEFRGTRQVLPRFAQDVAGVITFVIPYENIPRSETFEAVTWNIEWFGHPTNGPQDRDLQLRNAARVIRAIDADLYALQEISDNAYFRGLLDTLGAGWRGFIAPIAQTQRTAFIYKVSTIDSVSAGFTFTTGDWANGRWPYEFVFDARVSNITRRLHAVNIHGKATQDNPLDDYNRRVADSQQLKAWADANRPTQNLIILGDYNDDVDVSTVNNLPSPYANFVNDSLRYKVVTASLSRRRLQSQTSGEMIDHIMISNELYAAHMDSTERVENPNYVPSYLSTTSDHYPVWTRFDFRRLSAPARLNAPNQFALHQNYPNPFNPTTTIAYQLASPSDVRLEVFDVLGRTVATLVNERKAAGAHFVTFDARNLASGAYFYRLRAGGFSETKKMMLAK
ncbi:MAG: T9SS type A sorting domain-containing protein [Chloroherpetonaceae bacterium]|nr:T9SS type A sorting domain-containing protein [Chloroherpetonaceae bacterium]MDW8438754.1 T9SS type A sorting domain-containing protein [Chloroherpetonaceae bacterium]